MPPPTFSTPSSSPSSNENIVVAVRVRPFTRQEVERGEAVSAFEIQPATRTVIQRLTSQASKKSRIPIASSSSPVTPSTSSPSPAPPHTPLHFTCDRLFSSDDSTSSVYDGCMRGIVDSALQGMNGTVFAYGQTASGKTHTMKGSPAQPGLLPLSLRHVFHSILQRIDEKWLLRVSYLEIYQERIRDLLHPSSDNLPIHTSRTLGAHVEPREVVVRSEEEVLALLDEGERHRHYGQTLMNDFSSRSHTIFRLIIENKPQPPTSTPSSPPTSPPPTPPTSYLPPAPRRREKVRVSCLNFVDLAGSERHSQTQTQGSRLREALFINKSLLCLGLCIAKLGEGRGAGEVPYRDSKLTHLLSASLGGNSRVVVLCCIGPAVCNSEHSVSTLRFGGRCARVRQQARVNEVSGDDAEINRYEGKIRQLQTRLSVLPAPTPLPTAPLEEVKEAREVGEERRLLAEDRLRVEEERVRLERQIESFKELIMTATTKPGTGPAQTASAVRRRRATFGDGRSSGEWGKAVDPGEAAVQGTLSESQEEFFRGQQRERKVASLEAKVERLEGLLKELSAENSALMKENEEMEEDAEAMTTRLQEVLQERETLNSLLQVEQGQRRRWQEAEGVDGLSEEELEAMRRGVETVRARVERQVLWREFCKAREGDTGADEAGRMDRERALKEEVAALRARTAHEETQRREEESARRAALEEVGAEKQRLQAEAEEQRREVAALREELQGVQGRAAQLDGEAAEWEGRYQQLEAECRRVREENADYSKRLLTVIRPAVVAPQPPRLARELSAADGPLPSSVTYASYVPPSPSLQAVQAASAASTPMMSAHVPSSAVQTALLPSLSLDDLMSHHSASGQPPHPSAYTGPSMSVASAVPLHDITAQMGNSSHASPTRAASPIPFRSPSPFQLSAGKSAGKGANFGSAGKRPPVSQTRRK